MLTVNFKEYQIFIPQIHVNLSLFINLSLILLEQVKKALCHFNSDLLFSTK